jgi:hypothetical protein
MDEEKYRKAKRRVEELRGFYSHLITYILVNILLFVINLVTSSGNWWFYWPTIFWGIAVLVHASKTFILRGKFLGDEWERKKMEQIMKEDRNP